MLKVLPDALNAQCKTIYLNAHESLFLAGETPQWLFYVQQGNIGLTRCTEQGQECVLQQISQGFLAEASLFNPHYHCDAYAKTDCQLLAFPIETFRQQLEQEGFYETWILLLSKEIKRLRSQVNCLSLHTASERIICALQAEGQQGKLCLTQSKKDWAKTLGLTHESLYRSLKKLREDGIITLSTEASMTCIALK